MNRERRFPIQFQVCSYRLVVPIDNGHGWLTREYLDPDAALAALMVQDPGNRDVRQIIASALKWLKRDGFLRFPVVIFNDQRATILDMMKHYAYTTGSLHGDVADPNSLIAKLPTYGPEAGENLDPVEQTIVGIGRVVVRALRPLVLAIEGHYTPQMKGDVWLETDNGADGNRPVQQTS